jgi:hypothetical protein
MPYISEEDRDFIEEQLRSQNHYASWTEGDCVARIASIIKNVPSGKIKGACNYIISRIVAGAMKPDAGWGYTSLSEAVDVFADAESEMRRRMLDPYEDKAIEKNGDLPEFMT